MSQISILLGAGFSVPDKYPSRGTINARLSKIDASEIMVHTGGAALFLKGQKDVNSHWMGVRERNFIQSFLEFYNSEILKGSDFDYEEFFDFYHGLMFRELESDLFNSFVDQFMSKFRVETDGHQLLSDFHNSFNQLLGSLLTRWPKPIHLAKPYTKYGRFLNLIELLSSKYDKVHIHTLNHDLLIEELSSSDAMVDKFCDGYPLTGTPFYGMCREIYPVRLRYFTNDYNNQICLYKLHGSIDNYIYNFKNKTYYSIKILPGVDTHTLSMEFEENSKTEVDRCWWNYYPDFLSGTTEKITHYDDAHYYSKIFAHFKKNLTNSKRLISIGYGLGDKKINEFISEHFLKRDSDNKMLIVDPNKVTSQLHELENVEYYGKDCGVNDIELNRIENFIE